MGNTGIYKIQSKKKPERCYIGSSVNIKHRWTEHRKDLTENRHHSQKLQRHYNKYGACDLIFSVLCYCDTQELITKEQFYIDCNNSYFNGCKIAGSCLGFRHSEETKTKQSLAHANISDETRRKMSLAHNGISVNKGRVQGEEERKSRGRKGSIAWNKGLTGIFSEETLKKMSERNKGKKFTEEHKANLVKTMIGNTRALGVKRSDETRRKMSLAQMGNKKGVGNKGNIGKRLTEEEKQRKRETRAKNKLNKLVA